MGKEQNSNLWEEYINNDPNLAELFSTLPEPPDSLDTIERVHDGGSILSNIEMYAPQELPFFIPKGIDVAELVRPEEEKSAGIREFSLREGLIDFRVITNSVTQFIDLRFERNFNLLFNYDSLIRFAADELPSRLFSPQTAHDPVENENYMTVFLYKNDKKYDTYPIEDEEERGNLERVLNGESEFKKVELKSTLQTEDIKPFSLVVEDKKSIDSRAEMKLIMPLTYEWNKEVISLLMENHTDFNQRFSQSLSPQHIAGVLNSISEHVKSSISSES